MESDRVGEWVGGAGGRELVVWVSGGDRVGVGVGRAVGGWGGRQWVVLRDCGGGEGGSGVSYGGAGKWGRALG